MAANWKMNLSLDETGDLLERVRGAEVDFTKVDVLVAPPFTTLQLANRLLAGTDILLAGQNMHWEGKGAFTGEISPLMLKEAGCSHVILGHSERRTLFFETNEIINRKVNAAIEAGLIPILCIGETLKERDGKKTFDVIRSQLNESLKTSCQRRDLPESVVLAYEPVWSIGTGKTATPEQAQEVHLFVRRWLGENFDHDSGQGIRILYGGSVRPDNIKELMLQPDIDGALIGGASLRADSFLSIIRFYKG
ncbi:MAG: triose-phosphate isomerase [Deltaproteobacteria bacterium]|nr:MAG: triose-phosphate isomerase [Deltaproteobacteria bacterium]